MLEIQLKYASLPLGEIWVIMGLGLDIELGMCLYKQVVKHLNRTMNKILSLIIFTLLLTACGNKRDGEQKTGLLSYFVSITDNEDAGVKEILGFYGGQCKYAVGASASTKDGKKKYFKLELSKSDAIEKFANKIEMPASNIAYRFYKNLKEEKSYYDEIHSVIIFEDGTKKTFKYSAEKLELVSKRMDLANKVVELLTHKDYKSLKSLLNSDFGQYDKEELISNLIKFEPQFGDIKEFRLFGFRINVIENGMNLLHISGVLIREVQNSEFSIDVDLNSEKEEVLILQYKL